MTVDFYIAVAAAIGTVLSLVLHHAKSAKLKAFGDEIDKLKALAGK